MTHLRLGAGRAIVDLALEQARHGQHVSLLLSEDADGQWCSDPGLRRELDDAGVATTVIGDLFHRDPATLSAAVEASAPLLQGSGRQIVVHAHTAMTAAVARWAGAPTVVVTCHGWDPARRKEYDVQDALAYALADAVLSPSAAWAARVRALPGSPHVELVPYGFDLRRYPARHASTPATPHRRVVCVGELTARKGQDVLLEAWPRVSDAVPGVSLHFFGAGDAEPRLRARAAALDGHTGIHFHGHLDAPYLAFRDQDLFCLPTRSDNQPVAIIEAMLAGVPIVASSVGGIPEQLEGAPGCTTVPPDDVGALAAALTRGLSRPADAAIGRRIEALARQRYDVARCAAATAAVYEQALTRRRR